MNEGRTVFAQLMGELPKYEFDKCVGRYRGNHRVRALPAYEQFLVLAFAQLTYRESLRDIETCLRALGSKLYHSGIRQPTARSTLADANEKRDWRIFSDFAHVLDRTGDRALCRRAVRCRTQAGRLRLGLDDHRSVFVAVPVGQVPSAQSCYQTAHLAGLAGELSHRRDSDHGQGSRRQHSRRAGLRGGILLHRRSRLFGFRPAVSLASQRSLLRHPHQEELPLSAALLPSGQKTTGLRFDQTVVLSGFYSHQQYPEALRRIGFRDPQTGKALVFLTNNFTEPALTIALLYRCRWQIELFFKWIKQHLRIKAFYGTSENAVRIQVWTAISVYILVSILKKRQRLSASLYTTLQILSLSLFEKVPILQLLSQQPLPSNMPDLNNQPCLPGLLTGQ